MRSKDRAYSERRRRQTKKRYLIPLICTVAFLAAAVIIYACVFGFKASAQSFYSINVTPETAVKSNSKNMFYLSGTTLNCADKNGSEIWRVKMNSGATNFDVSDEEICIYSSDIATVLTAEGEHIYTVSTADLKTKSAKCGKESVALLCENETSQYLRVFNNEGQEIYRTEYPAEDILDYGFFGDNDSLYTLTLDTTGMMPVSRVTTMSPSTQTLTGTIDVTDQLISDVDFVDSDMILSGTSTLTLFDGFGAEKDSCSIYGLALADSAVSKDGYCYAFIPRDISELTTSFTARIIGEVEKKPIDTNIQLPSGTKGIFTSQKRLYCVMPESIYVYKLSGEFEGELETPSQITSVTKAGESELKVSCGSDVYILIMN